MTRYYVFAAALFLALDASSDFYMSDEKEDTFFGLIKTAVQLYRKDCNHYPSRFSDMFEDVGRACENWSGPYWGKSVALDTWGQPYLYLLDNSDLPLVISSGRDKRFGTNDDVVLRLFKSGIGHKNVVELESK